jgi:serine/threonine protein kinase
MMKYHTGGCLSAGDPTYIERDADRELLENLKSGEFCYVFNARQTGKSSLRDRAAEELKKEGWACVTVNLQSIGGSDTTIEQFYAGFLELLIKGVGIDPNPSMWLNKWIEDNKNISPVQWVKKAIDRTIVPKLINDGKNLVIFIDEIDNILAILDFYLDDFWGLIKSCYETEKLKYGQIQFVTFGVITPKEIFSNKYNVLNIGKAIELSGFTSLQMRQLLPGLDRQPSNIDLFLNKIYEYTGGQPFLTQKVFKLIQESRIINVDNLEEIEALIDDRIVSTWEYEERDSPVHLVTIRDRLLEEEFAVEILILYKKILENQQIVYDDGDPIHQKLRLSGVVVKEGKFLRIYNNIYKQVFKHEWAITELKKNGCMRGRYKIIEKIGKGGFGETFLAQDLQIPGNPYRLLKKFLPQHRDESVIQHAKEYFEREATILDNLRHDRIPRLNDFFEEEGEFYLVMEYIRGKTLAQVLSSGQLMSESEVIDLLEDILKILTYLHEFPFGEVGTPENELNISHVIHRDIKPSNIICRERDGKLVLIDFGAVKQISQISTRNQNRDPLTLAFNSGDYTPPEQYRGAGPKPPNDIYALGIVGLEALTGKTSDEAYTTQSATNPPISGSSDLREILDKMTRARISDRYQSARDVLADLAGLRSRNNLISPSNSPTTVVSSKPRKNNEWIKLILLALLAIITAFIIHNIFTPSTIPDPFIGASISSGVSYFEMEGKPLNKSEKELMVKANISFKDQKFKEAYENLYNLRQNSEDISIKNNPQLLIYMNNAKVMYWARKQKEKVYTIAAAFPITRERGEQALYGIAHLQHRVVNQESENDLHFNFRGWEQDLEKKPKIYLNIAVADDDNNSKTVFNLAKMISDKEINKENTEKQVIAVIGHYTSEVTCEALRAYNESDPLIPIISPLSTLSDLRGQCGNRQNKDFFRTTSSSLYEAKALSETAKIYLKTSSKTNPKIIVFYKVAKPGEEKREFSSDLFIQFKNQLKIDEKNVFDLNNDASTENGKKQIKDADIIVIFPDGKNANASNEDRVFERAKKVLKEAEIKPNNYLILGSNPLLTSLGQETLKKLHNKLVIATDWSEDIGNQQFISQYKDRRDSTQSKDEPVGLWGGSLNRTTALSYEAAQVLSELIDKGKTTRQDIINTLNSRTIKPQSYVFKDGRTISFDDKGDRNEIRQRILVTPNEEGNGFRHYSVTQSPTPPLP